MKNNFVVRISNSGRVLINNRKFAGVINDEITFVLDNENPVFQTALNLKENKVIIAEKEYSEEQVIGLKEHERVEITINPSSKILEAVFLTIFTFLAILFIIYILHQANLMGIFWILTLIPLIPFAMFVRNHREGTEIFSLTLKREKAIH